MDKIKIETMLEKEMFKYADLIKEHIQDFTMLYISRNNLDIDKEVAKRVLSIVRIAFDDGKMAKIDSVKPKIQQVIAEWESEMLEANPTSFTQQENGRRKRKNEKGVEEAAENL